MFNHEDFYHDEYYQEDPAAVGRGMVWGLVFGGILWAAIIGSVFYFTH